MEKMMAGEMISGEEESLLGGAYETVTTQKRGILFIEARIRNDLEVEVDTATVFHLHALLLFILLTRFKRSRGIWRTNCLGRIRCLISLQIC
jgi:hypothetical protein